MMRLVTHTQRGHTYAQAVLHNVKDRSQQVLCLLLHTRSYAYCYNMLQTKRLLDICVYTLGNLVTISGSVSGTSGTGLEA